MNHATIDAWLSAPDPTDTIEHPDADQRALDVLISTLRGRDGVDLGHLAATTGRTVRPAAIAPLVHEGLLVAGDRVRLTDAGFPLCDAILGRLADALVPVARIREPR